MPAFASSPRPFRCFALMPAGGVGARVGAALPKQYLDLGGRPVIARTAEALLAADWIEQLVVVVAADDRRAGTALIGLPRLTLLAEGGPTRRDTVLAGLHALRARHGARDDDWVLVHDAARPALDAGALARLRAALADDPVGGLLALPVGDTVKRAEAGSGGSLRAAATLSRDGLWLAQTPQMFRCGLLCDALERFPDVTDEAAAIERAGFAPRLVEGSRDNFKLTTAADLPALRRLFGHDGARHEMPTMTPMTIDDAGRVPLPDDAGAGARAEADAEAGADVSAGRAFPFRVGQGSDVHALVPGRPLIIGGVRLPHAQGLLGHSDADVLLHAITDALLGAASLGDIGRHFPDTDARFAGADSVALLVETAERVRAAGFEIANVDATIIAQAPRMAAHIPAMVERIAQALAVPGARVNVKAKTGERLGFTGRGEGIAAEAIALLMLRSAG